MVKTAFNLRFSIMQGLYWSAFCVMYTFLVPLYRQYGYDEVTIGALSMVASLATVLIQPLWGLAVDRFGRLRGLLLLNVLAAIPVSFGLMLGMGRPVLIGIVVFVLAATFISMGPMIDSWIMKLANQGHTVHYSLTRGIGSLVYAGVAVLFGWILDLAGMSVIPYAFSVLGILLVAVMFITPPPARELHHGVKGSPFAALSSLIKNRPFILMLVSLVLLYAGNGAIMVFMPVRMELLGGTNSTLGIAMTVMALSEFPAMLLHRRFLRYVRNETLLTTSLVFFVIKGVATALAPNVNFLILCQVLQFVSFGLYLPSAVQHINQLVDEKSLVTAMLLFASATYGVGMMFGGMAGGLIAEAFGVQVMMLLLSGVTFIGFLMFVISNRKAVRSVDSEAHFTE